MAQEPLAPSAAVHPFCPAAGVGEGQVPAEGREKGREGSHRRPSEEETERSLRASPAPHTLAFRAVRHKQAGQTRMERGQGARLKAGMAGLLLAVATIAVCVEFGRQGRRTELITAATAAAAEEFYHDLVAHVNLSIAADQVKGHLAWDKVRLRDEVYYLKKKVKDLILREYRAHWKMQQDVADDRAGLKEYLLKNVDKMTQLEDEVKAMAEDTGKGLLALRGAEAEIRRRLDHYKIHYDRDLKRIHAVLSNQTIELEKDRRNDLEAMYTHELQKMQDEVDEVMSSDKEQMEQNDDEIRGRIDSIRTELGKEVSGVETEQAEIKHGIVDVNKAERRHIANITSQQNLVQIAIDHLSTLMKELKGKQAEIDTNTDTNAQTLRSIDTQLQSAVFKIDMVTKKQATDHEGLKDTIAGVQKMAEDLKGQIEQQKALIQTVQAEVQKFAEENPQFKNKVQKDHMEMQATITKLEDQIKKADEIKKDVNGLQNTIDTKLNDLSSKIDDLSGSQVVQDGVLSQQGDDLKGINARIDGLAENAKKMSEEAKSDHDEVAKVIQQLQTKLNELLSLKSDIGSLEAQMNDKLGALQTRLDSEQAQHNQTRSNIKQNIAAFEETITKQIEDEKGHFETSQDSLKGLSKDISELKQFKADASKAQKELVKQLTDSTESLGILDSKFSGQNTDLKSQIKELYDTLDKVPTKKDFNKKFDQISAKGDSAVEALDKLNNKVGKIRTDQDRDSNNLAGLSADIEDAKAYIDKQWKQLHTKIQGEGDLFANVAKKLKDDNLQRKVNKVFERLPHS